MKKKKAERKHAGTHKSTAEYAEWLYTQGLSDDERSARAEQEEKLAQPETRRRGKPEKPKRRHGLRIVLLLILLLALGAASFHFLIARAPQSENALSARKSGCATILVAGTDEGGYRTDSMMLVNVNRTEKTVHLVSIPRDTLIFCEYSVPKINSAYGWAGGGEAGMQELLLRVSEVIGFEPDGYAVIDLSVFEQLVDLMGGITFDVPVDMHYSDPTQGLNIDLQAGKQHLNGEQAMQVARFRSGYATADIGRIDTQQDFLMSIASQFLSLGNIPKLGEFMSIFEEYVFTNMDTSNLAFFARQFLKCSSEDIHFATVPANYNDAIKGLSYVSINITDWLAEVNAHLNPYSEPVTEANVNILTHSFTSGFYSTTGSIAGGVDSFTDYTYLRG